MQSALASRMLRTFIQVTCGGAGGARTHDRRIMRSTAPCAMCASCTDDTVIALTALAALGLSDAPVHEPVHGRGAYVRSSCYCA